MKKLLLLPILFIYVTLFAQASFTQLGTDIDGEAAGDNSGYSVSMNATGDRIAIGARNNDGNGQSAGHVRVFEWDGAAWTQLGTDIDGEAAGDRNGHSVSMNDAGNRVAIGAKYNDGSGQSAGHVRIFEWDGTAWSQLGTDIDGEAAGDRNGHSVSMNAAGNKVAIGARDNDGNGLDAGHVRIFEWDGTAWTQLGTDIDGEAAGDWSSSVSMNDAGNRVAIGAIYNDGNGQSAGHVRIYSDTNAITQSTSCSLLTLSASNDTICSGASVVLGSNYSSINVTPTVLEVPNEYPTIQAAIDSASDYDTVYVHSGFYIENIVFNNKSIYLIGQDRNNTTIDGNQTCPVINLTGNSNVESLKIQNAGGVCYGGGIRATGNDSKLVRNCIITNNILSDTASTRGGAISGNNALRISNCVISNNFASSYCGGIYNAGFIQNSIVSNNHLTGIFGVDTIINCISFDNGIGVYNFGPDSTIIKNSTFLRNNEGVKYTNSLGNTIENSIFQENNKNITFWNNGSTSYSTVTTNYSILQGGQTSNGLSNSTYLSTYGDAYWGNNIYDTIVSFIDSANGNFNLVSGTPGYDQGNPDLNNNGISWANDPQDQDPDGSRMDLGYNSNFTSNDFGIGNSNFTYFWSTGDSSQTTVINPSQSGYYSLNINSGNYNCSDSIFIHVLNSSSYTEIQTTCDSIIWNGSSYDSTGIYIDTLQNYLGCDSVITLDLTVGQPIYVTEFQSDCDSVVWNGISYFSSGIYTDSLLTINGCDSIVTLDVDITGANLAFTVTPVSLVAPPFIFPFNNTTPNMGNFDFTWDFGDGTVTLTNDTNITHEYQYNGVYSVKLISEDMVNNCGIDTLEKLNLINCSGGPSLSIAEAFSNLVLYPNPARYMINISYGIEENFNNHYVEIINNLGQQVFLNTIDASNIQIPVSNLGSKGLYFINIRNESNEIIVTKHLIIN